MIAKERFYRYGEGFRLLKFQGLKSNSEITKKRLSLPYKVQKLGTKFLNHNYKAIVHCDMSLAYLLLEDLSLARKCIEQSIKYDVPENNHNASALHGIIALRQGDEVAARGAFVHAIGQADEILSKTTEYYDALDAKGLALCGLAIADGGPKTKDKRKIQCADAIEDIQEGAEDCATCGDGEKSVLRSVR